MAGLIGADFMQNAGQPAPTAAPAPTSPNATPAASSSPVFDFLNNIADRYNGVNAQKWADKRAHESLIIDAAIKDPTLAATPQMNAVIKKIDPDLAEGLMAHGNLLQAQMSQYGNALAPQNAPTAAPAQPVGWRDMLAAHQSELDRYNGLEAKWAGIPNVPKEVLDHLKALQQHHREAIATLLQLPEAKGDVKRAETQGGIDVSTAPANVAAETSAKSQIAGGEQGAREAAGLTPSVVAGKANLAGAEETARATARAGEPEKPADATRAINAIQLQAQRALAAPGSHFFNAGTTYKASPAALQAEVVRRATLAGRNPTTGILDRRPIVNDKGALVGYVNLKTNKRVDFPTAAK